MQETHTTALTQDSVARRAGQQPQERSAFLETLLSETAPTSTPVMGLTAAQKEQVIDRFSQRFRGALIGVLETQIRTCHDNINRSLMPYSNRDDARVYLDFIHRLRAPGMQEAVADALRTVLRETMPRESQPVRAHDIEQWFKRVQACMQKGEWQRTNPLLTGVDFSVASDNPSSKLEKNPLPDTIRALQKEMNRELGYMSPKK